MPTQREARASHAGYRDMKNLLLALAVCTACAPPRHNLAIDIVQTIEPDAKCTGMYAGEGSSLTYSASCRLPNKATLMCSVDVSSTLSQGNQPPRGLSCATIVPAPQTAAATPPPPPAPAPAPVAPSVVPVAPADAGR